MSSADDKRARFLEAQLQQLETQLMRCPFCGGAAAFQFHGHNLESWGNLWVSCSECQAAVTSQMLDAAHKDDCDSVPLEVAERWNRRSAPNEPRTRVAGKPVEGATAETFTVGEAAFACPSCGGSVLVKLEQPGVVDVLRGLGVPCDTCDKTYTVELRRSPR